MKEAVKCVPCSGIILLTLPQPAFQHHIWSCSKERNVFVNPEAALAQLSPLWENEFLKLIKIHSATEQEVGHTFLAVTWIRQNIFYCKRQKPNSNQCNLFFFYFVFWHWDVLTDEIKNPKDTCLQAGCWVQGFKHHHQCDVCSPSFDFLLVVGFIH